MKKLVLITGVALTVMLLPSPVSTAPTGHHTMIVEHRDQTPIYPDEQPVVATVPVQTITSDAHVHDSPIKALVLGFTALMIALGLIAFVSRRKASQ